MMSKFRDFCAKKGLEVINKKTIQKLKINF